MKPIFVLSTSLYVVLFTTFTGFIRLSQCIPATDLKLVIVIFRHGDRTPLGFTPKDHYSDASFWPDGFGQLTNTGKNRMFNLGGYFRNRYKDFLTDDPREMFIQSSAADRCLESALLVAQGCYRPSKHWIWRQGVDWQPFPIKMENLTSDGMLNPQSYCPNADKELERIRNSVDVISYNAQFKDLFQFLSLNTGQNVTNINDAGAIFDTLKIEKENGFKWPNWVDDTLYDQISQIASKTFEIDYGTKLIQKLRAGMVLKSICEHFKTFSSNSTNLIAHESGRKIIFYSSHDTLVAAVLSALDSFNSISPPYAASIIFELFIIDNSPLVKLFYLNGTAGDPQNLKINVCNDTNSCTLVEFLSFTKEVSTENWRIDCGFIDSMNYHSSNMQIYVALDMVLLVVCFTFILLLCQRTKRKDSKSYSYQLLPIS